MDASQPFMKLIRNIEDSQLNYSMTKTPFSATISLKCSFQKRFKTASQENSEKVEEHQYDEIARQMESEKLQLQGEIIKLQSMFDNEQKKLVEEGVKIQKLYDVEKNKSKDLEMKITEFREDILNIKKEKLEIISAKFWKRE